MCLKRQVGGKRQEVREWIRKVFVEGGISNILVLPFIQTYSILLSTTSQRLAVHPLSPERETCCMLFHLFAFAAFPANGCI